MKLIGYLRISSESQLDGYGLDAQKASIQGWARNNRHRVVEWFTETYTGTADEDKREKLKEALQALHDMPTGGIIAGRLDRFARKLTVQEGILAVVWRDGKKAFTAMDGEIPQDDPDDPMRTAIRQMQGVFAELDRAMITKRLRDGRRSKAEAGKHAVGQYRFGEQGVGKGRDRDAGPNPKELLVIKRIHQLRDDGLSYRQIAASLDADGFPPRRGPVWHSMVVRRIVLRDTEPVS
jgi:DNA invertase Pin-like site-specific DNA recombinase